MGIDISCAKRHFELEHDGRAAIHSDLRNLAGSREQVAEFAECGFHVRLRESLHLWSLPRIAEMPYRGMVEAYTG
jgi:hypothetical protein